MLILDGYKSYLSAKFQKFYKDYAIITLYLSTYSLHLTQPLDVGCFSVLKQAYSKELKLFIQASIDYITKTEFLIAFYAAYNNSITQSNVLGGFQGAGLVPFDLQAVILKLDIKLQTLILTRPPPANADPWVSQTLYTTAEAFLQSVYMQKRIANH